MKKMADRSWDDVYRHTRLEEIPWHSSQPDRFLVRLVREGKVKKGAVLDLCSGDGTNSIYLASRGFEVTGVDISPTAVRIARERCARRKVSCDYFAGDVLALRTDRKFDFVFDRGCFHHIPKVAKPDYVRLVSSLLKKGGHLFLLCFSEKNPPFAKNLTKDDIRAYFSGTFRIIFIKDSVHREPPTGTRRYLYACFLQKK
ncbi:MAG: class I SAM-dependent methyltransferase [Candidatus Aminicenantes bacterium]|nr:class I SAM-dependent methyltransferase [Candidatus Aminicenantes bacterium]